ncbi:MAG: AraC family transcriptional regulator [Clostridiales bacterium]|nr:AraC family transcriptional regulator [Clostridiales bacterium]
MKTKYWKNKTFWMTAFSYLFLSCAIVFTGYFVNLRNVRNQAIVNTNNANEKNISASVARMNEYLASLKILVTQIGDLPWAIKLRVDYPGIGSDYLSQNRKMELAKEFNLFVGANLPVKSISLVYPYKQVFITRNSWTDIDMGLRMIGIPAGEIEGLQTQIQKTVNYPAEIRDVYLGKNAEALLALCYPLERTSVPRVYSLVLLNVNSFISQYGPALTENIVGFRILRFDGSEIAAVSASGQNIPSSIITRTATTDFGWIFEFETAQKPGGSEYAEGLRLLLIQCFWVFFLGLAISFVASVFTYRPIFNLRNRILSSAQPTSNHQDDYEIISHFLDSVDISETEVRRSDLLLELLSNYEETDEYLSELRKVGVNLQKNTYFQTYIVTSSHTLTSDFLASAAKINTEMYCVRVTKGEYLLIAAFADKNAAISGCGVILEELQMNLSTQYINGSIVSGIIDKGVTGLRASWNCARNRERYFHSVHMDDTNHYYCPMELETRFVQALSSGEEESAVQILENLSEENERLLDAGTIHPESISLLINHISDILLRYMYESHISGSEPYQLLSVIARSDSLANNWACIERMCSQICKIKKQEKEAGPDQMPSLLADRIIQFTREHFADAKMSLVMVSDQFGISINTVNSLMKLSAGKTFLVYLTKCRIDEAKRLIAQGGLSVAEIADRTGYASDRAFRSAFTRYTGVSPTMYKSEGKPGDAESNGQISAIE